VAVPGGDSAETVQRELMLWCLGAAQARALCARYIFKVFMISLQSMNAKLYISGVQHLCIPKPENRSKTRNPTADHWGWGRA
jgi:hypothetical protein